MTTKTTREQATCTQQVNNMDTLGMSKAKERFMVCMWGVAPEGSAKYKKGQQIWKYFESLLEKERLRVLDFISSNEGWEESRDIYAKKLKLPVKYGKK